MNGYLRLTSTVVLGVFVAACSGSSGPLAGLNPAAPAATAASDGHGLVLHAVVGDGTGIVNVATNARTGGFVVNTQDAVHVRGVAPDTLLYVRVAVDAGLLGGQQSDGTCQRATLGQFGPIALFPGGPPATIETSPGGAGTVHIVGGFTSPTVFNGARVDLLFRIVDALPPALPTIDLRTDCFTIEIR